MSVGVELDVDRIAAAVRERPPVADLHGGRFGEIATYLPGRRVTGVRVRPADITVGIVGRYPATVAEMADAVRTAVGPVDRPVHVAVMDIKADTNTNTTDRTASASEDQVAVGSARRMP
ncbi:hypothetical protein FHU38_000997 [Saccharomonospora amisosensis]|uniref:Asp23/Gls24 family envelope stress response protein n=1 Tax=Saccharomonospora amisosensis TaxID=1128677 RepID=A0A7X5UMB8_9PSEU|nr:hypothetical protein [Saccharomonospora amisosensis]NIJ10653.1 hypothetical protein [Saccharomonospora amisosensis]